MLNKHGITTDIGSPGPSPSKLVNSTQPSPDNGLGSNTSSPVNTPQKHCMSELIQPPMKPAHVIVEENESEVMPTTLQKVTAISSKPEVKTLSGENYETKPPLPLENPTSDKDTYIQKCDICGMIFGETVTLHLHMIQDHEGQVVVKTDAQDEESPIFRPGSALKDIGIHLKRKYQRNIRNKLQNKRICLAKQDAAQPTNGGSSELLKSHVKSALVNHVLGHRHKKYRCAHCQDRFVSRVQCQVHIRTSHPHVQARGPHMKRKGMRRMANLVYNKQAKHDLAVRSKIQSHLVNQNGDVNEEVSGGTDVEGQLPVCYATPRDLNANASLIMQPFMIQENSGNFVPSMVYLPVRNKVNDTVTVSFTLEPTDK